MQDGYRIFGNGKSSKTTNKNQHHKLPSGLGYPKPEGKDEGESYTLFRTLPVGTLPGRHAAHKEGERRTTASFFVAAVRRLAGRTGRSAADLSFYERTR